MNHRSGRKALIISFILLCMLALPFIQQQWPKILYSPTDILINNNTPVLSAPSLQHWCGTDDRGRDVFSRLVFGMRNSILYCGGALAVIIFLAYFIGTLLGLSSSRFDFYGQRLIEIWSLLPSIQIALLLTAIFSSAWALFVVWCLFGWISLSQYVRLEVLRLKNSLFVEASRNLGASFWKIFIHDVLPNTTAPIKSFGPLIFSNLLLTMTSLDYLGLGLPPPTPSLGELLNQARENLSAWWLLFFPLVSLVGVLWGIRKMLKPPRVPSARIWEEKSVPPFPKIAKARFQEWVLEH